MPPSTTFPSSPRARAAAFAIVLAAVLLASCAAPPVTELTGRTMGTRYRVAVVGPAPGAALQQRIDARLDALNASFSTYRQESEISRFNRLARVGEPFPVSPDFVQLMAAAARVFELSGGAWDGTVMPLVDLWGFGPRGAVSDPPEPERLAAALAHVGFGKIEVRRDALVKRDAAVTLDLASIAKGYGVDAVAAQLRQEGYTSFLVEIGGEVFVSGERRKGRPWRVGVNRPRADAAPDEVYRVVSLRDGALATSGDYRQGFEKDGVRYSHILDPRTGRPVTNHVVSVSVQAADCTLADGLATAVMVMGLPDGLALLERLERVEGLVITQEPDGSLVDHPTSGFRTE